MTQLTGFSDPVYAEAYVNVNQFDIVLDVLVVNQTADTLQNLTLELATLGKVPAFLSYTDGFFVSPAKQKRDICTAFPASSLSAAAATTFCV